MPLDHSTATVTILLDGLGLFCFNADNECEIGVLKNPRHSLTVDILRIRPDGIFPLEHQLDLARNVLIRAVDNVLPGTSKFQPTAAFTRKVGRVGDKHDDFEDFRWIVDLEGDPFHDGKLTIEKHPAAFEIDSTLEPIIKITNGQFYSARLTGQTDEEVQDVFKLVAWHVTPPQPVKESFTIADVIGVDIQIHDDRGHLLLKNVGSPDNGIALDKKPNTRYLISIKNVCSTPPETSKVGTDFRRYYDIVKDELKPVKFDFDKTGRGKFPQNCDFAFLGRTTTLSD